MLAQLSTLKSRLGIPELDTTNDALLEAFIAAVSARFDRECNRILERSVDAVHEFNADMTELCVRCYPVETVTRFELKRAEADGWIEQPGPGWLVRHGCVVSLDRPLGTAREQGRAIYTGGCVPPGTPPGPGQTELPADLAQAAVEQIAWWFQNRDRLGLVRIWEYHSTYRHFADLDLLAPVKAVLKRHERWAMGN
jgi:hypothetical protein